MAHKSKKNWCKEDGKGLYSQWKGRGGVVVLGTRDWSDLEEKGGIDMVEARDWLEGK